MDVEAAARQAVERPRDADQGIPQPNNASEAKMYGTQMLELLDDMDALLRSHKGFLLGNYIESAKSWAGKRDKESDEANLSDPAFSSPVSAPRVPSSARPRPPDARLLQQAVVRYAGQGR